MFVGDRMTSMPVSITTDTSLRDALEVVRSNPFRHLPVVDSAGKLVGIVTDKGLVYAAPTSTTSVSIFKVNYCLSRMQVDKVMKT